MSSPSSPVDYFGITATPALIVAAAYAALAVTYAAYLCIYRFSRRLSAYFMIFTIFRAAAMAVRYGATRADPNGTAQYVWIITSTTLYAVGYILLLRVLYTLLQNWDECAFRFHNIHPLFGAGLFRRVFNLVAIVLVALSSYAGSKIAQTPNDPPAFATTIRDVVTYVVAACTVLLTVVAFIYWYRASRGNHKEVYPTNPQGYNNAVGSQQTFTAHRMNGTILAVFLSSLLLWIHVGFSVYTTAHDATLTRREGYFFPLSVVPEFLFVLFWAWPGLTSKVQLEMYEQHMRGTLV
ncbi:hypothetical protein HDU87_008580 [Geranomyces variabilis]|uniref:Uncharacterized protein n=1 Tax=Geranomyces variabilis TaxID=109894 RepID=A0AAD5TNU9_9FUNG|nr:hypothetical protein HDU87_008580 [Geranomyces variabilis]